ANTQMAQASINSTTGVFNTTTLFPSTPNANAWTQIVFGANQFYGVSPAAGSSRVYEFASNLASTWDVSVVKTVQGQPTLEASNGGLIMNTSDKKLHSLAVADGTDSTLKTLANPGY